MKFPEFLTRRGNFKQALENRNKVKLYQLRNLLIACMLVLPFCFSREAWSAEKESITVTILVASNQGDDFDMVNDEYRDRLIKLFSYSSYRQVDQMVISLDRASREKVALPEDYELILTLQGVEQGRYLVNALIRRDRSQFVNTVLSILKPGVVFLGGPSVGNGALILVLEMGF